MILYTQDELEKYTRMLARVYDFIRYATLDSAGDAREGEHMLKEIERTMGWNVPPPMKARPPYLLSEIDRLTAEVESLKIFKRSVLDPENQPSQYGTTLISSSSDNSMT